MRFTVTWTDSAEQDLAALWMAASDRNAVTSAAHILDQLLAGDPETRGEVRFDTVRSFVVVPLGVDFEVVDLTESSLSSALGTRRRKNHLETQEGDIVDLPQESL